MATKHRPMGNADCARRDDAKLELETANRKIEFVINPRRPMTEAEKNSYLKDALISQLRVMNLLNLMGTES